MKLVDTLFAIVQFPFFVIGGVFGLIGRPIAAGFMAGFTYLEKREALKLQDELIRRAMVAQQILAQQSTPQAQNPKQQVELPSLQLFDPNEELE